VNDLQTRTEKIGSREYVTAEFEPSDRLAVLIRNSDRKEIVQRITTAARIAEPPFHDWLHYKNERAGFDVYLGMNPLKPNSRTRTKDDILAVRHLYLDLDHAGPQALGDIRRSHLVPAPNYVLSTSPQKFQVVWRVEDVPQGDAENLLRAMARTFGADPAATDSTRVLRLPGFLNHKYENKFTVTAERLPDHVYRLRDFKLPIEHVGGLDPPSRSVQRNRTNDGRPLSQSEYDWMYAKRSLARGDDPEQVIRNIAAYRSKDKSNPEYYARHTVEKARAELNAERVGMDSGASQRANRDVTFPEK
jgi:hypothetical protein